MKTKSSSVLDRKTFFTVIALFVMFALCFLLFQQNREKSYRVDLLHTRLQDFNQRMHDYMTYIGRQDKMTLDEYVKRFEINDLRVTIIDSVGHVTYDSHEPEGTQFSNHKARREVKDALQNGAGYDILRQSESVGGEYFYSATWFPVDNYLIRSALPYDSDLSKMLSTGSYYLWFALVVFVLLAFLFYRMQRTRADFYMEREKLMTHLGISREGLGFFTPERQSLFVNSLFTKYSNLISDTNLRTPSAVLAIPEFRTIVEFLNDHVQEDLIDVDSKIELEIEKNGRVFCLECALFQDFSFEISINDVTEEEERSRIKRQMTQNIAHELRTPVSSIQGYLETILQTPLMPIDKVHSFLERSYAQCSRLTNLLRDISLLTRMDNENNAPLSVENINIHQLMDEIIIELSDAAVERRMIICNKLSENLQIVGNSSLIYSIFRNLLENAIFYAGEGTIVTVRNFQEDAQFYYFSFSDTGVGIASEHLGRIFERFYRVDKGRSRKLGGTGLGLAIVKNAVLLHEGSISAKVALGGGLEIIFSLKKQNQK